MNIKCAYTELLDLNRLIENPKNPNSHPEKQIEMLAKIIDYQGQRSPIVVSKRSGFITKGHGRLMAIKKLGWEKAAVDFQDYENEAQEYADMIADNKIAELAEHNDMLMLDEIKSLGIEDFDILGIDNNFNINSDDKDKVFNIEDENKYLIIIECKDELEQSDLFDEFKTREITCKIMS